MRSRLLAFGLTAVALSSANAVAAPQMLGLVATDRAVPFTCDGDRCAAELTAFCLEEHREAPLAGRRYRAVDPKRLTLVVTGFDGRARSLPATGLLRFVSTRRGVAAVRVEIDRRGLARFAATRIAVRVGANVSLAPRTLDGDKTPHTKADIARITGPMRSLGTRMIDRAGANIEAARMVNQAINRLPRSGRSDVERRRKAWSAAIAADTRPNTRRRGGRLATRLYRMCARWTADPHTPFTLRSCLEEEHKSLMSTLNKRYWKASRPGM